MSLTTAHSTAWQAFYDRQVDAFPDALFPEVPQHMVDAINTIGTPEGWALFDSDGSASGPIQIQHFDDGDPVDLGDDTIAWMLVWSKANAGSDLHRAALLVLAVSNQIEYLAIMGWVGTHQLPSRTDGPCNAAISTEGYWTCDSGANRTPCGECREIAARNDERWDDEATMFVSTLDDDGPLNDDWIHGAYLRQHELLESRW